jgi:ATP-dependent Clp protease ATP-binding subunit ClpC
MEYKLSLTAGAKKYVAEKGYDPQFGARPLNRAIQKHLEDPLAEYILNHNPKKGSKLKASLNKTKDGILITSDSEVNTENIKE